MIKITVIPPEDKSYTKIFRTPISAEKFLARLMKESSNGSTIIDLSIICRKVRNDQRNKTRR